MIKKILIANRGEIAMRISRACREMNIETVAVYSQADKNLLHVRLADEAYCIGGPRSADSYLNVDAVLTVALQSGCDAIHPGYGFLAENAEFADKCAENGIIFIGPSGDVIRKMGNKAAARALMQTAGVPVVPGSEGPVANIEQAREAAQLAGYPVLIKASAGGGGRGMRRADNDGELEERFEQARAEALACFADGEVYIEKLILNPKHIEIQVLADNFGNAVHLGERDCSVQRKNQKLIEESPSHSLKEEKRLGMAQAALKAVQAANYRNAGTIEFVVDAEQNFYFIEMNTRIQVEHPVTELTTGIDIVKQQIRIAAGHKLSLTQQDITFNGHAIECRINAENPERQFAPSPGTVDFMHLPGGSGVRVDSALYTGYELPPYYDSLAAKIIVHAPTRAEAIRRMRRALEETIIEGLSTNIELLHQILHHPCFVRGGYDTGFLGQHLDELLMWSSSGSDK